MNPGRHVSRGLAIVAVLMLADTDMQTVIGARQSLERLADSASS
jgi:hypothetical protein